MPILPLANPAQRVADPIDQDFNAKLNSNMQPETIDLARSPHTMHPVVARMGQTEETHMKFWKPLVLTASLLPLAISSAHADQFVRIRTLSLFLLPQLIAVIGVFVWWKRRADAR